MDAWREVEGEIASGRNELRGQFRVGCHASVAAYVLPGLFARLTEHAPGIGLELVHDFSRKITEQIVAYEVELGFVVNPFRHPDLVLKKVGEDRVEFWKKKGAESLPKRIFADPQLKQVQTLLEKTQRSEFKGWPVIPTGSLEVARELAAQGHGVAILPARVAKLAAVRLIPYRSGLPSFHDEIYVAYRKEVLASVAGRELARLATQSL
jgi:DNA-binding transcriptional LysR family regulator